ncbi:MAG: hypothetical protein IJK62_13800 [Bacteroidales bacterium]|nr:hypothetical protein [Bacteroidales bacterium]
MGGLKAKRLTGEQARLTFCSPARNGVAIKTALAIETAFANCFLSYNLQDCAKIYFVFGAILPNALDCAKITHKYFTHSKLYNNIKQALIISTVATRHDSTSSGGRNPETALAIQTAQRETAKPLKRRRHRNGEAIQTA